MSAELHDPKKESKKRAPGKSSYLAFLAVSLSEILKANPSDQPITTLLNQTNTLTDSDAGFDPAAAALDIEATGRAVDGEINADSFIAGAVEDTVLAVTMQGSFEARMQRGGVNEDSLFDRGNTEVIAATIDSPESSVVISQSTSFSNAQTLALDGIPEILTTTNIFNFYGSTGTTANTSATNTPFVTANNDSITTNEATTVAGNVFDNNGSGADSQSAGDNFAVTAVNGEAADVGMQITLSSGALLTLNADGTFSYNPNGQFENLGTNQDAVDTFTYQITDSNGDTSTATVTVTIDGINDAPILSDFSSNAVFRVADSPVQVDTDSAISLTDVDDANLDSATISITNLQDVGNELLAVDTSGTNIVATYDSDTGVLTLTGSDTLANYQSVLGSLTYENTNESFTEGVRNIEVVVNDGEDNSNTQSTSVIVTNDLFTNEDDTVDFNNVSQSQFDDTANPYAALDGNDVVILPDAGNQPVGYDASLNFIAGNGNDTVTSGDLNDNINGGDGIDTISYANSSAGVNVNLNTGSATGNGDDFLLNFENVIGSNQNDTITGNTGNNVLTGSGGDDTFVFGLNSGNDTITDFDATNPNETIDVSAYGLTNTGDFNSITQVGSDTIIDINGTDTIQLTGVNLADIDDSDFIF